MQARDGSSLLFVLEIFIVGKVKKSLVSGGSESTSAG
jgi:hypothetical protein